MNSTASSVERRLEMLAAVARRTGNAVIVTDAKAQIEWVNAGFERLTGYEFHQVIGRRPADLLQGAETSLATRTQMSAAIAAGEPFDVVVLNYTRSGRQYWVRIDAAPMIDSDGAHSGYIAIETDVTEQRIAEVREAVLRDIGVALLQCDAIEDAARVVVDRMVQAFDVRAASIWLVEPGQPQLRHLASAGSSEEADAWRRACEETRFHKGSDWVVGVGAPGVAWGTGKPCQRTDFWEPDKNGALSRRALAARHAGIRTVSAVPVFSAQGVTAVIEIGGSHNYPGYERLPQLVEQIAHQFGAFVVQRRNQDAYERLFHMSPDALLVLDDDERVHRVNARAAVLFGEVEGRFAQELFQEPLPLHRGDIEQAATAQSLADLHGMRHDTSSFPAEVSVSNTIALGAASTIVSVRDLTERRRQEAALRRSLAEKTTLVQEVHHRVKNNLQVISSLVALQCSRVASTEVRAALEDTSRRIQSIALVHQLLYASDELAHIDLADYLRSLSHMLQGSLGPDVTIHCVGEPVFVTVERASPVGLVVNELMLNAAKHGRDEDGRCEIELHVRLVGSMVTICVCDRGPGFDPAGAERGSMGQTLIRALCRQLRASLGYEARDGGPGTIAKLAFAQLVATDEQPIAAV